MNVVWAMLSIVFIMILFGCLKAGSDEDDLMGYG